MELLSRYFSLVSEAMTLLDLDEVEKVMVEIRKVKADDGVVYTFGNGGSHATAAHFANDLMKVGGVRSVCISDMSPTLYAYGNDEGWDLMFANMLGKLLRPGDGVLGLSASGSSPNVCHGLYRAACMDGVVAVGLTGVRQDSWINKVKLNALVHVTAEDIRVVEDLHLMVCHAMVRAL